jgi:hypothetical protein
VIDVSPCAALAQTGAALVPHRCSTNYALLTHCQISFSMRSWDCRRNEAGKLVRAAGPPGGLLTTWLGSMPLEPPRVRQLRSCKGGPVAGGTTLATPCPVACCHWRSEYIETPKQTTAHGPSGGSDPFEFAADSAAAPGNLLVPLAALLIALAKRPQKPSPERVLAATDSAPVSRDAVDQGSRRRIYEDALARPQDDLRRSHRIGNEKGSCQRSRRTHSPRHQRR